MNSLDDRHGRADQRQPSQRQFPDFLDPEDVDRRSVEMVGHGNDNGGFAPAADPDKRLIFLESIRP